MYARYIPPPKGGIALAAKPRGAPVIETQQDTSVPSPQQPAAPREDIPHEPPESTPPPKEVKKRKREKEKKRKKDTTQECRDADDDVDDGDGARHATILAKRERSLKIAETVALADQGTDSNAVTQVEEPIQVHDIGPMPQPPRAVLDASEPTYGTLPDWLARPIKVRPELQATFGRLGIDSDVCKALEAKGLKDAFPIQMAAIKCLSPIAPSDPMPSPFCRDLLISAGTGSGKTLAYCLPLIRDLCESDITNLRGIVILPTRELVAQVSNTMNLCAEAFGRNGRARLHIGTAVGNHDIAKEHLNLVGRREQYMPELQKPRRETAEEHHDIVNELARERFGDRPPTPRYDYQYYSKVDIVICTPDRLFEHLVFSKGFKLDNCRWIIIDEADKLLVEHYSFDRIMTRLQLPTDPVETIHLRKVIVGATLTRDLNLLSALKLRQPRMVVLTSSGQASNGQAVKLPATLKESMIKITRDDAKPLFLLDLLAKIDADSSPAEEVDSDLDMDRDSDSSNGKPTQTIQTVLVFVRDNLNVSRLRFLISELNPALGSQLGTLTSKMRTTERKRVISLISRRKLRIVIASDLVSRGLDVGGLDHVINYDVPNSVASYVHRVGRTARAGRQGSAWTLVSGKEMPWFKREVLGQEDIKHKKKMSEDSAMKVVRVHDVERVSLATHKGIGAEREARYEEALSKLELAVKGE